MSIVRKPQHLLDQVLIDEADEEGLAKEQEELDGHDDTLEEAMIRVKRLITLSSCSVNSSMRQSLIRQLSQGICFSP